MIKNCLRCNDGFISTAQRHTYCKKCTSRTKNGVCLVCSSHFYCRASKPGKFCSIPCKKKYITPRPEVFCEVCNNKMHYYPSRIRKLCSFTCKGKWQLKENNGPLAIYANKTYEQKLEMLKILYNERVIKKSENECWEWNGVFDTDGYGRLGWNGKLIRAHRASYLLNIGKIPEKMVVMHSCDSPPCTNWLHLKAGTPADNNLDKANKGRSGMPKGMAHWASNLTLDQITEIKKLYKSGGISQRKIGMKFGITQSTVWRILNNISYKE